MPEHFFLYNDTMYPAGHTVISTENRSFRYGDGLFETMKMVKGRIINKEFHFERLFKGLFILDFELPESFNPIFLQKKIDELNKKNGSSEVTKIRLMVFRGNGGIFEPGSLQPNYIIETSRLPSQNLFNKKGLAVDVFPNARKSCDLFSNLKSNNYLPYVMAGLFAKKNNLDDCIILNCFERICEGTIANIFIIEGENIYTPPLSDGCVAGTMRRWMLEKFDFKKYRVIEKRLDTNDLTNADEVFLTNSTSHLRWVEKFRNKTYSNEKIKEIYEYILQTI
jgi:branched-chain amino acid aminotransferase